MKKVFWKCNEDCFFDDGVRDFAAGKEYKQCIGWVDGNAIDDRGYAHSIRGWESRFTRIEREVFEVNGKEWFKHTPGDPMPCDGANRVSVLCGSTTHLIVNVIADNLDWRSGPGTIPIIAWRYAETKPSMYDLRVESCVATPNPPHIFDGQSPQEVCAATNEIFAPAPGWAKPLFSEHTSTDMIKRVCAEYSEDESEQKQRHQVFGSPVADGVLFPAFPSPQENDEMVCADMPIVAIEDSSLTPAQRRHWEEMEAKQAAKEQLRHDAETKALKERADQLADAGRAMDRVNQDHSHKLGWRQ